MNDKCLELENWLAVAIGNSRLHWAWFRHNILIEQWDTPHLSTEIRLNQIPQQFLATNFKQQNLTKPTPIYLASVVPKQTKLWQNYADLNLVTLKDVDIKNIYPTMGIDRALAVWGAGETYGYPCLVIDGGTALTFTAVNPIKQLLGGAILPGLRLQFTSLKQRTANLPEITLPKILPPRWTLDTNQAIASGVIHTQIAGIHSYIIDWQRKFLNSKVIFTGGDANVLAQYLSIQFPEIMPQIIVDQNLVFWGIKSVYKSRNLS
ncbi:pantothenate kinase [Pleurocapsa sp. PCC 7319]|uniref:pantothenate kinase n=1 Tax=Pleurocapsa sp. PCC 7319 TaxID=118161 RepID=UPI00034B66AB|nr:pantothenate kinase [Pleurocapsa sp. PCC 7319]